jgi:eukaryotic-like serine/threonine-protein kinase
MADHLPARFGPFEVLTSVGSGGMGEVYRARDSRLNRDVAIKVMAQAADPNRLRRFTDEAQAASALNHPNILTVFDVGTQDGAPYIVSELIEGTSLRSLLVRAPLPVREVLDLGAQMADGLAAAHQAGIVHRDFKPENVMVTREGRVKILDFGLAQTAPRGSPPSDLAATLTNTNVVAGTVPYMSPEQACGSAVDYRTDQFSFGLVLYELLTARRAFQAATAPQTLAAILEDDPEPVTKLNPRVPAPLRWIIDRCLAKDPRQRYESTTDLARDLRTLRDRLGEFASSTDIAAPPPTRRRRSALGVAAAAAVGFAAAFVTGAGAPRETAFGDYRFTPFATDAGYQGGPEWSPDGKTLVYVASVDGVLQVFTKAIGSPLRAQVTHARFDCRLPFWSPDGTLLYYISLARDREGLWSVSAVGGEPELVMENVRQADISPDGQTLALWRPADNDYSAVYTLWLSSPPGNPPTQYTREPFGSKRFIESSGLHFSPDGSKIGVWATSIETIGLSDAFWIVPTRDADPYLARGQMAGLGFVSEFAWLPDSRHIVSAAGTPKPGIHLWLSDTDGTEQRLLTPSGGIEADPAVSPDGTRLAMSSQSTNYDVYQLTADRPALDPVLASARNEMDPAWSRSGAQMAFSTDRSGTDEIWLRSQSGDFERPLITPTASERRGELLLRSLAFAPDGQRLAYHRSTVEGGRIWISPVAGGQPVELSPTQGRQQQDMPSWSPDAGWIAFAHDSAGVTGKWSLSKARVGAKTPPVVLVQDIVPLSPVKWSPTNAWIAFNGQQGLGLVSPDGQVTRPLVEETWLALEWSEDGQQLFGIRQSDDYKHLTFTSVDIRSRTERVLAANVMPLPIASEPVRSFARVSGTTFLTSIIRVSSDIWLLDGFNPSVGVWDRLAQRLRFSSR